MDDLSKYLPAYIDPEIGLSNCGYDEGQYKDAMRIVVKYGPEKKGELKKLLSDRDYENFLLEIHALKNNFATVGAMDLATRARELESDCRAGKKDNVIERGMVLLEDYANFIEDLRDSLKSMDKESGLIAGDSEIAESLSNIADCIKEGNFDEASDLFEVLAFFNLSTDMKNLVDIMRSCLMEQDGAGALKVLEELR